MSEHMHAPDIRCKAIEGQSPAGQTQVEDLPSSDVKAQIRLSRNSSYTVPMHTKGQAWQWGAGLQSRGSQGRGRGRGDQRGPGGNWPGEARGAGYAQGNGQPHSALLNPPSGSGAPQMKRRPSKAESNSPAAGPSSVEAPTPGPPASEAASTAPAPSAAPSPSGT